MLTPCLPFHVFSRHKCTCTSSIHIFSPVHDSSCILFLPCFIEMFSILRVQMAPVSLVALIISPHNCFMPSALPFFIPFIAVSTLCIISAQAHFFIFEIVPIFKTAYCSVTNWTLPTSVCDYHPMPFCRHFAKLWTYIHSMNSAMRGEGCYWSSDMMQCVIVTCSVWDLEVDIWILEPLRCSCNWANRSLHWYSKKLSLIWRG